MSRMTFSRPRFKLAGIVIVATAGLCMAAPDEQQPGHQSNQNKQQSYSLIEEEPAAQRFFSGAVPRSRFIADDSSLNDVCSVGPFVWAVGDRGVVLRSNDVGITWQTKLLPFECTLTSVCFLTNRIGFIGGSVFDPFERSRRGLILKTVDGGETWQLVAGHPGRRPGAATMSSTWELSPVSFVKFFDLENAVAICISGHASAESQVIRTQDGGVTWKQVQADVSQTRWTAGAFLSPRDGILVGKGNSYGALVSDQVVVFAEPGRSLRRIVGATVASSGHAWLAGDGGLLLHSDNGGISWNSATEHLPKSIDESIDFHTVDQKGSRVCVAGSPGSAAICSEDGGTTWNLRKLPGTVPLKCVRFLNESTLIAVGALGVIHRSTDGGQSWNNVRNGSYRAAVLCLTTEPQDCSFRMLSVIGGEQGFRTIVAQPSARQLATNAESASGHSEIQSAVTQSGGNDFVQDWMFSRTQPLHKISRIELLKTWERQTDGKVGEILPRRLAQLIRVWRPDVICVEKSGSDDQLNPLLLQALQPALQMAAVQSSSAEPDMLTALRLKPWPVQRVLTRVTSERTSALGFAATDLMPRLGTTTDLIADFCRRQIVDPELDQNSSASDSYSIYSANQKSATPGHFLAGLMQPPGSDSRRQLAFSADGRKQDLERIVQQDRIQRSALRGHLQQSGVPLSLIADLQSLGRNLPPTMRMKQLLQLASMYEKMENQEGEIAVLKEICIAFPDSPRSADAAEKLYQYFSSSELRLLRTRAGQSPSESGIQQTSFATSGRNSLSTTPGRGGVSKPAIFQQGRGTGFGASNGKSSTAIDAQWDRNANEAMQILQRLAPVRATSPRLLIRDAANHLRRQTFGANRTALSQAAAGDGLFAFLARAEMNSVHGSAETSMPVIHMPQIESKPLLDAKLTEDCWQDAAEVRLTDHNAISGSTVDCLVMMAWDADHLYVAGRIERSPGQPVDIDRAAERRHDASHGTRDRIEFMLDTDRDYTTGFHFTIDEAGQTSERCWHSRKWNPQWFVAADADEATWSFEAAIPHEELSSSPIRRGQLWAVRMHRIVPGALSQSLKGTNGTASGTDSQGYGLLRFLRPK